VKKFSRFLPTTRLQLRYYLWRLAKEEVGASGEIHAFREVSLNTRLLHFLSQNPISLHVYNYYDYYGYWSGSYMPRDQYVSGHLTLRQTEHHIDHEKPIVLARLFVRATPNPSCKSTRSRVQTSIVRHEQKPCKWHKISSNSSLSRSRPSQFFLAELPAKRYIRGWFTAYLRGFETTHRRPGERARGGGSQPTYEDLKPGLRGLPRRAHGHRSQPTYEDLKRTGRFRPGTQQAPRSQPTYEDLKRTSPSGRPVAWVLVRSLPMRI